MSKNDEYYKLSSIVDDYADDIGVPRLWHKLLKWAIRGIEEINLDVTQQPKTCLLPVTSRKTVILPSGFVDWTKVAAKQGQYAITLGTNDSLTRSPRTPGSSEAVHLLSHHIPNGTDLTNYSGYYFVNYSGESIFSIGYGIPSKGYFKVHDNGTCKELLMDYDFGCSKVYLEYITDGFDPCGETIVHPYLKNYVLEYMNYQYERFNNPKRTQASLANAEISLELAKRTVRARHLGLTPKDLLNSTRKHFRLSTKI
jgi:hypothetical protein